MSTDHFIPELEETEELHEHYRIIVDNGQQPERIDKFLMLRIAGATRNRIQNGILAESVLVNNKPTKNSYKVKPC